MRSQRERVHERPAARQGWTVRDAAATMREDGGVQRWRGSVAGGTSFPGGGGRVSPRGVDRIGQRGVEHVAVIAVGPARDQRQGGAALVEHLALLPPDDPGSLRHILARFAVGDAQRERVARRGSGDEGMVGGRKTQHEVDNRAFQPGGTAGLQGRRPGGTQGARDGINRQHKGLVAHELQTGRPQRIQRLVPHRAQRDGDAAELAS